MDFEFIDETDIQSVKRGRKTTVPQALVDALSKMPTGKAVRIKDYAGDPTAEDYKSHKASVSAMIRTAGRQAGVKVSISWSPDGVPQVKREVAKAGKRK